MKPRLYLETTVISYVAAEVSRDPITRLRQELTKRWWDEERYKYDLVVSATVEAECKRGEQHQASQRLVLLQATLITIDRRILELAEELTGPGAIPLKAGPDAVHVAAAVIHKCDYLLTWNLRHLANARIRRVIEEIIEGRGYGKTTICTPEELF